MRIRARLATIGSLLVATAASVNACRKDDDGDEPQVPTKVAVDPPPTPEQQEALALVAQCTNLEPSEVVVAVELTQAAANDWCEAATKVGFAGIKDQEEPVAIP